MNIVTGLKVAKFLNDNVPPEVLEAAQRGLDQYVAPLLATQPPQTYQEDLRTVVEDLKKKVDGLIGVVGLKPEEDEPKERRFDSGEVAYCNHLGAESSTMALGQSFIVKEALWDAEVPYVVIEESGPGNNQNIKWISTYPEAWFSQRPL